MPNPLKQKDHDLSIKTIPPASPTQPRVPLAEEFDLESKINIRLFQLSRPHGWHSLPKLSFENGKLHVQGQALSKIYPSESLAIDTSIAIPPLDDKIVSIKRDDVLSLVAIAAEVGIDQDSDIGISFRYRDPQTSNVLTTPTGIENSRRYRAFWLLALSSSPLTAQNVLDSTSLETNGDRRLAIVNNFDTGFLLTPTLRVWAADGNWASGLAYTILPDSIEVLPICSIERVQNYQEDGIIQGYGGEAPLTNDLISSLAVVPDGGELANGLRRRLLTEICAGIPGKGKRLKRIILNLSAGQAAGNPGKAGTAASSPNGSYCMGNDQRVSFTNQQVTQTLGVNVVTASNDGSGKAIVATGLNTNAPLGSVFSGNRADHRIYATDGTEQSALGTFSNLGGSGSLQWVAGQNSTILPGSQVYFVPAIIYPAGSGFSIPFLAGEAAWYTNGTAISPANIRFGMLYDLDAFEAPANQESFIVITGSERAAIHYLYKLVTVVSDANGVVAIPTTERGCFAFIQNVPGRIDAPVCTGLAKTQSYQALVYYPPRSQETWQFQFVYPEYQGTGGDEPAFLDGATIVTPPLQIVHTQGGGLSVHNANTALRSSCVAMQLPSVPSTTKPYQFDAPIQLLGESYAGPITLRSDIPLLPAANLNFPTPGQVITLSPVSGTRDRSINAALTVGGFPLGCRSPVLASRSPFQLVVAFVAKKGDDVRLVVITHNCGGSVGENVVFDPTHETAIDIFNL